VPTETRIGVENPQYLCGCFAFQGMFDVLAHWPMKSEENRRWGKGECKSWCKLIAKPPPKTSPSFAIARSKHGGGFTEPRQRRSG